MITYETLATPDGDFTLAQDGDGPVVAAGWSDDPAVILSRAGIALSDAEPGACPGAAAVRAYYDGDLAAPGAVEIRQAGTEFQEQVWRQLRAIPAGELRTYGEVAEALGNPGAARAVGAACGANRVALFVPCHRVSGASGALTGFAWGVDVKRGLIAREVG